MTLATNSGAVRDIVTLVLAALIVIAHWKIFTKAGQKGWASIIPILNIFVLVKLVKRPMWWAVVLTITGIAGGSASSAHGALAAILGVLGIIAFVVYILIQLALSKSFGHGVGYALGLIFLPFIFGLILGYGSSTYQLEPDPLF